MRPRVGWVDGVVRVRWDAVLADERRREPVRMADVVETEAALDAEAVFVRRALSAADVEQLVVLDMIGELAADATIGADAVDRTIGKMRLRAHVRLIHERRRHQRAGR